MHVWQAGPDDPGAPTVLAVHGLGGSGRYWQGLANRMAGTHRLIAPDLAGFGRSEEPTLDAHRALHLGDLDAVIEATAPASPVWVIGHSLGGVLAALWASDRHDRVAGLALGAAPFPTGKAMDFRSQANLQASPLRRAMGRGVRTIWPVVAVPVGLARGYPPAAVIDFGRQSIRSRAWTLWSLWSDPSLVEEIQQVDTLDGKVPILLAHAGDDRTVKITAHGAWTRLLPHAEEHVVERGGHQFLLRTGFEPVTSWLRTSSGTSRRRPQPGSPPGP
jgi:pimeloyl-ACP methyl ester carboxylesterase